MHSTRSRVRAASAVVAVVFVLIACGGVQAEGPVMIGNAPPPSDPPNPPTCTGITAGTAQNDIGQAGGEVRFNDRDHVLAVPPNVVSNSTTFTIVQEAKQFVHVKIEPSFPVAFRRPVMLTLSYKNCVPQNGNSLKIYRRDHNTDVWEELPSLQLENSETVSALIGRLSDYAIGSD